MICLQNDDLRICPDKPRPQFLIQSALHDNILAIICDGINVKWPRSEENFGVLTVREVGVAAQPESMIHDGGLKGGCRIFSEVRHSSGVETKRRLSESFFFAAVT